MVAAPLRILVAIMILEIPLISTDTPTSVPIVQIALEGHLAKIRTLSSKLVAASAKNQPQPSTGFSWNAIAVSIPA